MRFLRYLAATVVASLVALSAGGPAAAHNALVEATPKRNAVLKEAPAGITLRFLQTVGDRSLSIDVVGSEKQKVATGEPRADGKLATVAFTDPLPNGEYTVTYRVVSRDGHPVQGSYDFTVRDPSAAAEPAAQPSAPAAPSAVPSRDVVPATLVEDEAAPWWPIPAAIAGAVLVAAGALIVARRRR